jgi:hypothetical protein
LITIVIMVSISSLFCHDMKTTPGSGCRHQARAHSRR